MKKLFPKRNLALGRNNSNPDGEEQNGGGAKDTGHTLDRIISAKEDARRKWVEQEEAFQRQRREHELKMIAMENAEVDRRSEEVRRRIDELDDKKRKNRLVQDTVAKQILTLQEKLEDYKLNHKAEEESMEDEIAGLEDTLAEVKATLERRKAALDQEMAQPSAPAVDDGDGGLMSASSISSPDSAINLSSSPPAANSMMYPPLPAERGRTSDVFRKSHHDLGRSSYYHHPHLANHRVGGVDTSNTSKIVIGTSSPSLASTAIVSGGNRRSYDSSGSSPNSRDENGNGNGSSSSGVESRSASSKSSTSSESSPASASRL